MVAAGSSRAAGTYNTPMTASTFKVITFDLDNTLWDVEPVLERAEARVYAWLDQHAPAVTRQLTPDDIHQLKLDLLAERPDLKHQISAIRRLTYQRTLLTAGYDEAFSQHWGEQAFQQFLDARHAVTFYEDVLAMLQALSGHYLIGALTNGNADIQRLPLGDYFDFSFSAEQLNASKPDPRLFRAAVEHADCLPAELLHIGDDPECDVIGARNAGCVPLWFNPQRANWPGPGPAPAEIERLLAIPDAITRVAAGYNGRSP